VFLILYLECSDWNLDSICNSHFANFLLKLYKNLLSTLICCILLRREISNNKLNLLFCTLNVVSCFLLAKCLSQVAIEKYKEGDGNEQKGDNNWCGMAGLSTGCYLQINGYETQIFEMSQSPGGLCTSWKRKEYVFDGYIH